ncbi:uncharacterized protein N7515_009855 [Penicillium bovifimosum]|uniref:Linalool dehydratase/isomerase domain-containing protein n=1 Tax=Penicillium bovifimosum TaxID=126998 RepID=A0A9W9GHD5_9EURO|nr:uncharacterized protein N7515_009855 [Penicillium bovifimosum]KAJ5120467.1 hypothetical protein N7515_009855 [Penicillium bovifimosum]
MSLANAPVNADFPLHLRQLMHDPPKLTKEQCGHLRHIYNLASQLDGDWAFMGCEEPGQEWDTARRYQLATMSYAVGAAHYHRLPAMRSMFKPVFGALIRKMLRREVWDYWYLSSQSGKKLDPDLKELRKPWADPVCKENIMYSGHLLNMVSLFSMLFNDDQFDQEGAITFKWNPLFWGMGEETFSYTRTTLQKTILAGMESEGWVGVCCEPNWVFIICNQFPILATRYNDVRNGTRLVDDVLRKYKAAWADKGFIGENGLFRRLYATRQKQTVDADDIGHSAWTMAFMPWNYDLIQSLYPAIGSGFLYRTDDRININPPAVANEIRRIVKTENADPDSPSVLSRAREITNGVNDRRLPYLSPVFGYVAQWLSEIAGPEDLSKLLRHADAYLTPSWSHGGLYYQRCDQGWDNDGNYTYVDPHTGNAAIAYARLNVKNGQKKMWDHPWTRDEVQSRPWIDGINFGQGIDCLRGEWSEQNRAMIASFRTWHGSRVACQPVVLNLPFGKYGVYINSRLEYVTTIDASNRAITVDLDVGAEDVDLVIICA